MDKQPEALHLADELEYAAGDYIADVHQQLVYNSAAELRRLHSVNAELLAALQRIEMHQSANPYWASEVARAAIAQVERSD